ncbi:MAG TPA: sigma-70 family RNA polymerase sigma factor [Acidimicrobiales bacterium]|nr:sigma-70 family RNA polymerase sigma factor [Acidimicrobiales bacterium]
MVLPPFPSLVEEHRTAVWGYLVALVGRADAPDLYQDTVLSALRAYPKVHDASNLRSWLLSVAHSRVVDRARARARRPEVLGDPPEHSSPVVASERDDELWSVVADLPEKQRHAVVLRFVGDLSYAAVAELTDTSEAAARQNVRAALARLRKELS